MLKREITILRMIKHTNIIQLLDAYEDEQYLYLVFEHCEGGELYETIQFSNNPLNHFQFTEQHISRLVRRLLLGLRTIHRQGIVHRDLKPENILFTHPGIDADIKLIDFGLATMLTFPSVHHRSTATVESSSLTVKDNDGRTEEQEPSPVRTVRQHRAAEALTKHVGTPYYIAPEILGKHYSSPVDLWSTGVITYILLCGYPPFGGENEKEIYQKIRQCIYSFDGPEWLVRTSLSMDFIRRLLEPNPVIRMTLPQALLHPWIIYEGHDLLTQDPSLWLIKIHTFRKFPKLKQFIYTLMSIHVLSLATMTVNNPLYNKDPRSRQLLSYNCRNQGFLGNRHHTLLSAVRRRKTSTERNRTANISKRSYVSQQESVFFPFFTPYSCVRNDATVVHPSNDTVVSSIDNEDTFYGDNDEIREGHLNIDEEYDIEGGSEINIGISILEFILQLYEEAQKVSVPYDAMAPNYDNTENDMDSDDNDEMYQTINTQLSLQQKLHGKGTNRSRNRALQPPPKLLKKIHVRAKEIKDYQFYELLRKRVPNAAQTTGNGTNDGSLSVPKSTTRSVAKKVSSSVHWTKKDIETIFQELACMKKFSLRTLDSYVTTTTNFRSISSHPEKCTVPNLGKVGTISLFELAAPLLPRLSILIPSRINRIFHFLDRDQDGYITQKDLLHVIIGTRINMDSMVHDKTTDTYVVNRANVVYRIHPYLVEYLQDILIDFTRYNSNMMNNIVKSGIDIDTFTTLLSIGEEYPI